MRFAVARVTPTLMVMSVLIISNLTVANSQSQKWINFGKTNSGEKLRLDISSIKFEMMAVDDTINMEGRDNDDVKGIPMHRVIAFKYNIGGRNRSSYTTSCSGRKLTTNPGWRTFTSYVDYWPQYFSINADGNSSVRMLKKVCELSQSK